MQSETMPHTIQLIAGAKAESWDMDFIPNYADSNDLEITKSWYI